MTGEEARARFDAALDRELTAEEEAAFARALADDPELRAEFERYRALLDEARRLGRAVAPVDLLAGVQEKLRARSGGRFYRDRFAMRRGRATGLSLMIALSLALLLLSALWFAHRAGVFAG